MPIFTPEQREQLRHELVSAAQNDSNICGAAHTGSAASQRLDRWSDIDLALCVKPNAAHDRVVAEWTERFYQQHEAVAHVDVMRGATLFRVFLLKNTLQVDIAFWSAADFAAIGPNFRLIFGDAQEPQPSPPSNRDNLIGMAWLYALHVRSCIARRRVLQADYMLSGMRNHVFELTCIHCGVVAQQGRGLDDLPDAEKNAAAICIPRSVETAELKRAFQHTMRALIREIHGIDTELETRVSGTLNTMTE